MYIEYKGDDVSGPARIGRVSFSKSGRTIYYRGRMFIRTTYGTKSNYFDAETGEQYWISGCKNDGSDRLYGSGVDIDDDVREEYWSQVRGEPDKKNQRRVLTPGKYTG
jgi:hypothetical protein